MKGYLRFGDCIVKKTEIFEAEIENDSPLIFEEKYTTSGKKITFIMFKVVKDAEKLNQYREIINCIADRNSQGDYVLLDDVDEKKRQLNKAIYKVCKHRVVVYAKNPRSEYGWERYEGLWTTLKDAREQLENLDLVSWGY